MMSLFIIVDHENCAWSMITPRTGFFDCVYTSEFGIANLLNSGVCNVYFVAGDN